MFKEAKIALIGSGAMGEAIIKVVLDKELIAPQQLTATDALPGRCTELAAKYGIRCIPTLAVFSAGKEVARLSGALDATGLKRWLAQNT